ncbi:hypothetical protein DL93DRAFT_2091861, partial [Clavulina sp. PMI_390]
MDETLAIEPYHQTKARRQDLVIYFAQLPLCLLSFSPTWLFPKRHQLFLFDTHIICSQNISPTLVFRTIMLM